MRHKGYITVTVSEDIDVDIDEIMDDIPTDDLIEELKKRKCHDPQNMESCMFGNISLSAEMKMQVINENIHKFSYEEICQIFESKKF